MTKKEELLTWINNNIDEFTFLKVEERVLDPGTMNNLSINETGKRTFVMRTHILIDTITNDFDDNLIGTVDTVVVELVNWDSAPRPTRFCE